MDATPTYSYARMLYKYPQAAYPYAWLVAENGRRSRQQPEFEILDTGIFDEDRYFDVDIEYAKADVDDLLMRITVTNRGPEAAQITILPQVWFRNTWNWFKDAKKPSLKAVDTSAIGVEHETLGSFTVSFDQPQDLLFCDNESNARKLFGATDVHGYFKDAFHEYLVRGNTGAVNPARMGTKAAGVYAPTERTAFLRQRNQRPETLRRDRRPRLLQGRVPRVRRAGRRGRGESRPGRAPRRPASTRRRTGGRQRGGASAAQRRSAEPEALRRFR